MSVGSKHLHLILELFTFVKFSLLGSFIDRHLDLGSTMDWRMT